MVMMMVVMVPMVVVVMVVIPILSQLNTRLLAGCLLVNRTQHRYRVWNRIQQLRIGLNFKRILVNHNFGGSRRGVAERRRRHRP
jgi:hypothetical protein